ncbi:MAG: MocR-like transcription factor YczR [Acidimicrobiales bacterium]
MDPSPLYRRLAAAVRALVLDARLASAARLPACPPARLPACPPARLPAERTLATELGVSRTTVTAAYEQLRAEGFLLSRQGGGSWVTLPAGRRRGAAPWALLGTSGDTVLDLSLAAPTGDPLIETAYEVALEQIGPCLATTGYDPHGLLVLREAIARRYSAKGVETTPDQILVTSGSQQAVDVLVRALVSPLDPVVVECPTYPNVLDLLRRARCRVLPVTVSPRGWDEEGLTSMHRRSMPRLTYVIADYQNPTGNCMDAALRATLVDAAVSSGTTLCVDETFAELSFDGTAPRPSALFDRHVVSIGSMSKAYWAGLRIGWIRAEPHLIVQLQEAKAVIDMASPLLEQLAAAWLLDNAGDLLARHRAMFAANRDALVRALSQELGDWRFETPHGGLSLWVELHAPVSTNLAQAAHAHGLRLAAGPRFGIDESLERFLRIPFTLAPDDLAEAVHRLAATRRDVDAGWGAVPERAPVA